jgi:hypothetical protein
MKVQSPLAELDIGIGAVSRSGNELVLRSRAGSSVDAVITVSAREVLRTIGTVLSSPGGLLFLVGLPYFCLRQRFATGSAAAAQDTGAHGAADINKPW